MITVGSFEAKTHLAALLDRVAAGEEIAISRRGKIVARLVPDAAAETKKMSAAEVIAGLKENRKGTSLGGISWKELRDEGRR
ncbi:MAG: type II toxin-antitoxin system prevent-host-death family antitoxin [Bdellovibrionales bacterium]|jgi:prevent-host-death family protein